MRITVQQGETLWDAIDRVLPGRKRPCGGNGTCGGCNVQIKGIGTVPSCQFRQEGTYDVILPESKAEFDVILPLASCSLSEGNVAVDIGTTTIAIARGTQNGVEYETAVNPQRVHGADVLSRIRAAKEGHLQEMKELVNKVLWPHIKHADKVWITGNTTMLHLFRGDDCGALGVAPFVPKVSGMVSDGKITTLPVNSAFVGADVVCGIYEAKLHLGKRPSLLVDLGTNGEIAVGKEGKLWVSTTAAGPAFEGSEFLLSVKGANVIHILAKLRKEQIIDEYGTLAEPYFTEGGIRQAGGFLSQDEIRDLQMAKAAIRAGVEILLKEADILPKDVENVYLAGGMGMFLQEEDAIAIGLFPEEWNDKVKCVGNLALQGTMSAMEKEESKVLSEIARQAVTVTLADHPEFEERYIAYMNF